jgi:hypothetical protein
MANDGRDPRNLLNRIHSREIRQPGDDISEINLEHIAVAENVSYLDSKRNLFTGYSKPIQARAVWMSYMHEFVKQGFDDEVLSSLREDIRLLSDADELDFYLDQALQSYERENVSRMPMAAKTITIASKDDWPLPVRDKTQDAEAILGVPGTIVYPLFVKGGGKYYINR